MTSRAIVTVALVLCAATLTAQAPQATSPPACAPIALPAPLDAYAREVDDKPSLRLVAAAEAKPRDAQRAAIDASRAGLAPGTQVAIRDANGGACSDPELEVRAARLAYGVDNAWGIANKTERESLGESAAWAMRALRVRERLAPDVVDAALAPFVASINAVMPTPVPSPSNPPAPVDSPASGGTPLRVIAVEAKCVTNRQAHLLRATAPAFPDNARGMSGHVGIVVQLDDEGLVQLATIHETSVGSDAPARGLQLAALVAAATSAYAPEVDDCKPVGGRYLFETDYGVR